MNDLLLDALKIAYASVGIIGLAAYFPTLKDLYHHKKPSANIHSYLLWSFSTLIAMLYSYFILDDFLLRLISTLNFIACFVTLLLIAGLSKK